MLQVLQFWHGSPGWLASVQQCVVQVRDEYRMDYDQGRGGYGQVGTPFGPMLPLLQLFGT